MIENKDANQQALPPRDRFNIVYLIFTLLGIGVLAPWNFFITANDYFIYKLNDNSSEYKYLTSIFFNSQTMALMIPYAVFNLFNIFLTVVSKPFIRFHIGNITIIVCFVLTAALVETVVTSKTFFTLTIITCALIGIGGAILQGASLGILSYLPSVHMTGYLEGQSLAGILSSVTKIFSIAMASDKLASATAYFAFVIAFLAIVTSLFLLLFRNPHFSYYMKKAGASSLPMMQDKDEIVPLKPDVSGHEVEILPSDTEIQNSQPIIKKKKICFRDLVYSLKEPGLMGFMAFFSLFVSLTVFPPLFVDIKLSSNESWKEIYYIQIFVFLLFNICDYLGRKLASKIKWPRQEQSIFLLVLTLSRIIIVIAVLFCNQSHKARFPVLFENDVFIPIFITLLGLTNGYFLTLAFMYAPSYASPGKEEQVGVAMGIYVALGLSFGVATSFIFNMII